MPEATPCRRCGEILQAPVSFCPFCGLAQAAPAAPAPVPPAARPAEPSRPVQPAPTVQAATRQPIVPPVAPAPPPRTSPGGASPVRVVPVPSRPPRRRPTPAARAAAIHKLLLAGIILACAAVLWHHLTFVPRGTLLVHLTRPVDGMVLVDGSPSGVPDRPIPVDAGRHEVGFAAPGWSTVPVAIALHDGSTRTVSLSPSPSRATLGLDSVPPGASLSLNGRRIGHAPASLSLPPGSYRLGAELPGFEPDQQRLTLAPGERRSLGLVLQPPPVRTLHLSAPAGAWSDTVTLPPHAHVTILFGGPIRLRVGGRVVLLDGGAPAGLGSLDGDALSFTAVGGDPVPVLLLVRSVGAPG